MVCSTTLVFLTTSIIVFGRICKCAHGRVATFARLVFWGGGGGLGGEGWGIRTYVV